jgi:rSAM/selenodomain-associated transferase 1
MTDPRPLLIQFARAPEPGRVKTRMQPTLSSPQALQLHRELMRHCCRRLVDAGLGPVELWLDGPSSDPAVQDCASLCGQPPRIQMGNDLGERMFSALADGLARHRRVILVGSDCPAIDGPLLHQAAQWLEQDDLVVGPALDGGYYLVGARRAWRDVFRGIDWGSGRVLAQTEQRLAQGGYRWRRLPTLQDVDRPADLPHWQEIRQAGVGQGLSAGD